jgi:hypothetical protein
MKKLILVLAIALIASPAMALNVYLEKQSGVNVVDVKYSDASTANLPRAFALKLTITGGTFDTISGYKTGESTAAAPGFGIFPARIQISSTGTVSDYGTPLAAEGAVGTTDQTLPSSSIVLEFGSLYDGAANAPLTAGTLCSIAYTKGTATQITLVDETTYRGGIVLEDGTQLTANNTLTLPSDLGPATNGTPTPNVTTATGALNTDLGWTAGAGATSYDVYFGTVNPPAFVGNTTATTYEPGVLVQGQTYYVSVVAKAGSSSAAALDWSFNTDCYKTTSTAYAAWESFGKPSCWCYQRNCRGDADGVKSGLYWVYGSDLTILQAAFGKNDATLKTIANGICADFDRTKSGLYRVYGSDLTVLQGYFGKGQASVPVCDAATVNFWTN